GGSWATPRGGSGHRAQANPSNPASAAREDKLEIRNPKPETNPKHQKSKPKTEAGALAVSDIGISAFGFRVSDFGRRHGRGYLLVSSNLTSIRPVTLQARGVVLESPYLAGSIFLNGWIPLASKFRYRKSSRCALPSGVFGKSGIFRFGSVGTYLWITTL